MRAAVLCAVLLLVTSGARAQQHTLHLQQGNVLHVVQLDTLRAQQDTLRAQRDTPRAQQDLRLRVLQQDTLRAQQDTLRAPPIVPAVIGGALGSALGAGAGIGLFYILIDDGVERTHGDAAEAIAATFGFTIGSTLGAAGGAYTAARLAGGTPSFRRTLFASSAGLLMGAGAALLLSSLNRGPDGPEIIFAYTITQGTVAGLAASAWQRRPE